ncbi:MAG: hypothetical protein BWY67_02454 [Bacteroidetes bacterium ADurb.Bin397]|nr:MAG: hypothetical protein BWY67_02454 [Bacteroidetes bacterium ADurb.Bin397]
MLRIPYTASVKELVSPPGLGAFMPPIRISSTFSNKMWVLDGSPA